MSFSLRRNSDFEEPAAEATPELQAGQMLNVPLGTLIYRSGLLSQEEVQEALAESIRLDKMLGEVLLERGMVEERELGRLLAGQKGLPFVELDRIQVDRVVAQRLPEAAAREHSALPVAVDPQGTPLVAVVNPDPSVVEALTAALGAEPHVGVAARGELLRAIDAAFGTEETGEDPEEAVEQPALRLAEISEPDVEPQIELVEHETEDVDVMPTASAAEAPESFEDESASTDDESSSEPGDSDESHRFPWERRDEEVFSSNEHHAIEETFEPTYHSESDGAETGAAFDETSEDESSTETEEPVLALVGATEHEWEASNNGFSDTVVAISAPDAEVAEDAQSEDGSFEVTDSFGDETVALTTVEPERELVMFDERETTDHAETVDETDTWAPAEEAFASETEVEDVSFVAETADEDEAGVAEAVEAEVAAEVFVTLSNGERLMTGRFASKDEASSHALALVADVKRNWWPQVDGRLIRPDAILTIDVEHTTGE